MDEQTMDMTTTRIDVPAIADDRLIEMAEQAEKRVNAIKKIKQVALKVTNVNDWVDQSDRPYLQASGGEKIARLFGISWRIWEPEFQQLESGHFSYTYKGEFALGSATIEAVGTRSSKDPFFKKYAYSEKDENGHSEKTELPPSEIDKGDVKKAAYTNLIGNGITRLLGIRNLTYEDLQTVGITKEAITRFKYKKGGKEQAGKQGTGESPPMSEAQRKKLWAMMKGKKLSDDSCKKVLDTIKTVRDASAAIENLDAVIQKIASQPAKEKPTTVKCPEQDDTEIATDVCESMCNTRQKCPVWK